MAFAVGSAEAVQYRQFGIPKDKIRLVPDGIDVDALCPGIQTAYFCPKWRKGLKLLGYVGRLDLIKGLVLLLNAFPLGVPRDSNFQLVIIGPKFGVKKTLSSFVKTNGLERGVSLSTLPQRIWAAPTVHLL